MWKLILVLVFKQEPCFKLLLFLLLQIDVKVFVYNHINKKDRWLLRNKFKEINKLTFRSSISLPLESTFEILRILGIFKMAEHSY